MVNIYVKIIIPFGFVSGNKFYHTDLTIEEFDLEDIHIKIHIDKDNSFMTAETTVEEDKIHSIEEISEIKIGKALQAFFDGLSKAFDSTAFFNVFNGDEFVVDWEFYCDGLKTKTPFKDKSTGLYLDDWLISQAIDFANYKDDYIKQAFIYLKEGKYLNELGRYNSAIIQFAIMEEYLINHQLRKKGMINSNGDYLKLYKEECEQQFYGCIKRKDRVPFSYSKYVYGLSKLGYKMDSYLIENINIVYRIRNKLAHGYDILRSIRRIKN